MYLATLPFDYVALLDTGDRVRRAPGRPTETRVRAGEPRGRRR